MIMSVFTESRFFFVGQVYIFTTICVTIILIIVSYTLFFRLLDDDNGGTVGFPEIQKVRSNSR